MGFKDHIWSQIGETVERRREERERESKRREEEEEDGGVKIKANKVWIL